MQKGLGILGVMLICACQVQAQLENGIYLPAKVVDGDTIAMAVMPGAFVAPQSYYTHVNFDEVKYVRLIRNVKRTLPYAKMAKARLDQLERELALITDPDERDKYVKEAEKSIRDQFEENLKKLSVSQGKILIRLIDRETGQTSFQLVKDLRGPFQAFFWQSMARMFGSDLKMNYDPTQGDDQVIEEIIQRIEAGTL